MPTSTPLPAPSSPPTPEALTQALESSLFLLPEVPGLVSSLSIPGLRGRSTSVSFPLLNLMGCSTLTAEGADRALKQLRELFARERKSFGWLLGPSSTPADLEQRLQSAGLVKVFDMAGLALTDLHRPIHTAPDVHVRPVSEEELEAASRVLARAFPAPEDVCRLLNQLFLRHLGHLRARVYLAWLEGIAEPVAYACSYMLPDLPVVLLYTAATLPEYRHRRIYSSLVARRLEDARRDGAQAAIIQAVRSTSAPICRAIGFTELCTLPLYGWFPLD